MPAFEKFCFSNADAKINQISLPANFLYEISAKSKDTLQFYISDKIMNSLNSRSQGLT